MLGGLFHLTSQAAGSECTTPTSDASSCLSTSRDGGGNNQYLGALQHLNGNFKPYNRILQHPTGANAERPNLAGLSETKNSTEVK